MELVTDKIIVGSFNVDVIRNDQYISRHLRLGCEWDGWMRSDLPHLVKPGRVIIDIGGNIGYNSLMFSDYAPVYTYEPIFHSIIQKNVDQNVLNNPVKVHPYGLSSTARRAKMFLPNMEKTGVVNYGGASLDASGGYFDEASGGYEVALHKLDDVYCGPPPCIIKMDVERHEMDVIKGAWNVITRCRPAMYIEILDTGDDEITPLLNSIGYKAYERPEHNYLFIST